MSSGFIHMHEDVDRQFSDGMSGRIVVEDSDWLYPFPKNPASACASG
jgi:hypothetical protein